MGILSTFECTHNRSERILCRDRDRDRNRRHPRGGPDAQEREIQVVAVATRPYFAAELGGLGPDLLINDCESGRLSLVNFRDSLKT